MALDKKYDSQEAEPRLQESWIKDGIYAIDWDSKKEPFSIDTPPPTMSGKMHLGHAFSYAQGDFIARYMRMRGFSVVYPWGTDDNGLPTERLVEKKRKLRSHRVSREEFVKEVLGFLKEESAGFSADWKRLGISADFSSSYSTIDPHCQATSQKSFLDLYEKGLVFRQESPISWCVRCQTAIAQAEFESVEKSSEFHEIAFEGPSGELVIGTTRPELIPACVALAAHPEDERYTSLKGKKAKVPLFDYEVPIIFDKDADPDLGTGLMMVCTFGDKEDVEKWHRHDLELRKLFTEYGHLTDIAGEFADMKIVDARKAIVEALEEAGFLKSSKSITHATNVHERCSTPIEFLLSKQWFVKVLDFKDDLLKVGEDINWYPEFMHARYKHWVENLGWDWCISRQRHFGVPFPVWYDKQGNIVVADVSELPIDPASQVPKAWEGREDELTAESDVLDTWATSSVTPQIVARWFDEPAKFEQRFPMTVRRQAHDIIRTWAFYTIVKSLHHHGVAPWRDIVISGHGLDPKGKKMSKSKGNVIDPGKMIEKYSADAVRYWAASTRLGEDLSFQEKEVVTGQKTVRKLWNASRFATMHLEDYDGSRPEKLEALDEWLLAKFAAVLEQATASLDKYEYSQAKQQVDNFFWNVFCDYYLELVKDRLYNEDVRGSGAKLSAQYALYQVLLGCLKLFAPIMPHVTEEIFTQFFADHEPESSIHVSAWPVVVDAWRDADALSSGDVLVQALGQVRKFKSDNEMSLAADISEVSVVVPDTILGFADRFKEDFSSAARAKQVVFSEGDELKVTITE